MTEFTHQEAHMRTGRTVVAGRGISLNHNQTVVALTRSPRAVSTNHGETVPSGR